MIVACRTRVRIHCRNIHIDRLSRRIILSLIHRASNITRLNMIIRHIIRSVVSRCTRLILIHCIAIRLARGVRRNRSRSIRNVSTRMYQSYSLLCY